MSKELTSKQKRVVRSCLSSFYVGAILTGLGQLLFLNHISWGVLVLLVGTPIALGSLPVILTVAWAVSHKETTK